MTIKYEVTGTYRNNQAKYIWDFFRGETVKNLDGRESYSTASLDEAKNAFEKMNEECAGGIGFSGAKIIKVTDIFDENGEYEDSVYEDIA
jgi:hypothetical protein